MNFLNIGPWELMLILGIAILLVGPRRVAEIARTIGRVTSQMRRLSDEFVGTIRTELLETERETRQALKEVSKDEPVDAADIRAELQTAEREARQAMQEISDGIEGLVQGRAEGEERAG